MSDDAYRSPQGGLYDYEEEKKHSGIGIASFVISLIAGVGIFALFIAAGVIEASSPGGMHEESAEAIIIGLGIIFLFLMELVAIGLGIGALFSSTRKKLFGILGLSFSAGVTLLAVGIMVLGVMAS
jgi:hypothetical protein